MIFGRRVEGGVAPHAIDRQFIPSLWSLNGLAPCDFSGASIWGQVRVAHSTGGEVIILAVDLLNCFNKKKLLINIHTSLHSSYHLFNHFRHTSLFNPPLPPSKVSIIELLSIGVVDKIVLRFPEVWWPQGAAFFAFLWSKKERENVSKEDFWLTTVFGASSPLGCGTALTLWTNGHIAKTVETLPDDVIKRKSMELIRRFMGKDRTIPDPIAMIKSTWFSNPYTRGSYTYDNLLTPSHPNARSILAEPILDSSGAPRLLFAGEATDSKYFSTVHGAMNTGHREAARLLPKPKL